MRGQVLATEPLDEPNRPERSALRPGWLRLLAAAAERPADLGEPAATRAFATEETRRGATRADPEPARRVRRGAHRPEARRHAPLGRYLGETPDRLPLAGAVAGTERLWVAGGYSGHGTSSVRLRRAGARAVLGDAPDSLPGSIRAASPWAEAALQLDRRQVGRCAAALERRQRDCEILDRKPCRVEARDLVRTASPWRGGLRARRRSARRRSRSRALLRRHGRAHRRGSPAPSRRRNFRVRASSEAAISPCPAVGPQSD